MIKKIVFVLTICSSAASIAGEQVWDFGLRDPGNTNGNTLTYQSRDGFNSVTASAWSSTGSNGCGTVNGKNANDRYSCIEDAKLKSYGGGLGVQNRREDNDVPNHSIDNTNDYNDRYPNDQDLDVDMVLLTFDHEVKITGFGTGWNWVDSDVSIVAYTGNNFTSFGNSNWSQILSNGWEVVDNKSTPLLNSGNQLRAFGVNDTDVYSKNWLVGAYSAAFSGRGWTDTNDGFKLNGLTAVKNPNTDPSQVSAPATLGMFALFGLFMAYRRK